MMTVRGKVVDNGGKPIRVMDGGNAYGNGKSDDIGNFRISHVPESVDPSKVKYGIFKNLGSTLPDYIGEPVLTSPLIIRVRTTGMFL
jgi:hypothetical protein